MKKVFVSYAFRAADEALAAQVEQLLASLNVRATTGKLLGGEQLTPAVMERIEQADGLIALLTRRDAKANGGWTSHPWVDAELAHARSKNKRTVALVEEGVDVGGPSAQYQYYVFSREQPLPAFLALAETVGLWKQEAGRTVKVRILPDSLARELGAGNGAFHCRHRFFAEGQYTDWAQVTPVLEPGGVFVYLGGVRDEYMIELTLQGPTATWASQTTPLWMQIALRRRGAGQ